MNKINVNKVILIGHLGTKPEAKTLESGSKVVKFSLATTERYKDKSGQKQEVTEWHSVEVWGKLADVAEKYLDKGSKLYIEGKIKSNTWEDEQGNKRKSVNIQALSFQMGSKQSNSEPSDIARGGEEMPSDDLPF